MVVDAKIIVLLTGLLIGTPMLAAFLVLRPRAMSWALFLLVVVSQLKIDLVFFSVDKAGLLSPLLHYRGYDRGLPVVLADLLLPAMGIALLFGRRHHIRFRDAQLFSFVAYFLVILGSMTVALNAQIALWEVLRTLRWIALFWVIWNAIQSPREIAIVIAAGATVVLIQVGAVLYQRYLLGLYRTPGTFAHPNSLGMAMNLWFPLLLACQIRSRGRASILWAVIATSAVGVIVLSLSRGALLALGLSAAITFTLSLRTVQKGRLALRAAMLLLGIGLLAIPAHDTILARMQGAPMASLHTRLRLNDLAARIIAKNPFGVGANNFAKAASESVRFRGTESGSLDNNPGLVHNAYLLEAAETGWLGLTVLLLMVGLPFWRGLYVRLRRGPQAWLGTAIIAASIAFCLQSLIESAYKQSDVFSAFVIISALASAAIRLNSGPAQMAPRASGP